VDQHGIIFSGVAFFFETALEISEFKIPRTADEAGKFAFIVAFVQGCKNHTTDADLKRSIAEKVLQEIDFDVRDGVPETIEADDPSFQGMALFGRKHIVKAHRIENSSSESGGMKPS